MANIKTNNASNIKEEDNQSIHKETSNPINVKKELTEHTDLDSNNDDDINIKNEQNTSFIQNRHHYPGPVECIVYWDYYTHPIPKAHNLRNIITTLKQNICNKIGSKPIQFRIYSSMPNMRRNLQDEFDINGIKEINVSHHTSITNRLLIDISLKLHESEKHKKSNCIGVISEDKEIAHLLSRIHKEPAISNSFIISFNSNTIHPSSNNVDFVLTIDSQKHINNANDSLKREREHNTHKSHLNTFNTETKPFIIMIQKLGATNNKKFPLIVLPNDSIKQVKLKMHINEIDTLKPGVCISIHILFNDRILDDKDIIGACGINNGNTIHWKPVETVSKPRKRLNGLNGETKKKTKSIIIMLQKFGSYNNKRFKLSVLPTDSIQQMKVKMHQIIHASFNIISFNGRILYDKDIVGECGIGNGDMIHWDNESVDEPKRKKMKLNEDKWEFRKFGYIDIILKDMKTKQSGKFHVSPDDTIHNIRLLMGRSIPELKGVDCSGMVLMFRGVELTHIYYPLSWYNICNGDIIEWQMKQYVQQEKNKNKNKNYSMQVITDTSSATLEMPKLEAEFV